MSTNIFLSLDGGIGFRLQSLASAYLGLSLICIEIDGEFQPIKKDGAGPEDVKRWKKEDPLYLLRMALVNKLRSKHWRSAHAAKKNWMEAAEKHAKISGTPAETPATVIIEHALPNKCDIDAPVKVLLDAFQSVLLSSGDDKDIELLILRRKECKRNEQKPRVVIYAYSNKQFASFSRKDVQGSVGSLEERVEGEIK